MGSTRMACGSIASDHGDEGEERGDVLREPPGSLRGKSLSSESGCWSRRERKPTLRSLLRAKGRTSGYADPALFPSPRATRP
jgi:hypothetical protein